MVVDKLFIVHFCSYRLLDRFGPIVCGRHHILRQNKQNQSSISAQVKGIR